MIMEYFGFDTLTREQLEDILREGAIQNQLNRISPSNFNKLISALDIPLDGEESEDPGINRETEMSWGQALFGGYSERSESKEADNPGGAKPSFFGQL